ncbi:MAG: hypothetical protein R3B48_13055 [Kofleriaceae bacterium]
MGERWKHARAASFAQQQCSAYERELKTATLFSRTAKALEQTYACTGDLPVAELVGTQVLLKVDGNSVAVLHGNSEIGRVVAADERAVSLAITSEPHCPGMALGVVEEAASVAGEFVVRIINHTEER